MRFFQFDAANIQRKNDANKFICVKMTQISQSFNTLQLLILISVFVDNNCKLYTLV